MRPLVPALATLLVVGSAACVPSEHVPPPAVPAPATPDPPPAERTPAVRSTARLAPPPQPSPPPRAGGDPAARTIQLLWTAPVDLDLYVIAPDGVTIYFGNPETTHGTLRADLGCAERVDAEGTTAIETVDLAAPTPGTYRVGVELSDPCAARGQPVPFRIVAELEGLRRETSGTLAPGAFAPAALLLPVGGTE